MMDNGKLKYDSLKSVLQFVNNSFTNNASTEELIDRLNAESCMFTKCRVAAVFLLDHSTFEFMLTGKYSSVKTIEADRAFNFLIENSIVPNVLLSGKSSKMQINDYDTAHLIPLTCKNKVFALQLLITDKKNEIDEEQISLLSILNSTFAILLNANFCENENAINGTQDKTELINQIEYLKKGTQELHHIIDSIQEGIFLIDKSTKQILDVNQTAVKLISTSKESLIGKYKDDFFLFFDNRMFNDEITTRQEAVLIDANGNSIPILHSASEIILGEFEYEIISFLDITERKMMEDKIQHARFELEFMVEERTRQLQRANEELENEIVEREKVQNENLKLIAAVQQTTSLIFITDIEGKIQYANPALCNKAGYQVNELLGQKPSIFKSGELTKENYEYFWNVLATGKSYRYEYRNRKKNGELYWVSSNISPIKNELGSVINFLAVQEDITERKEAELELKHAKEKVEKAEKAKSSLLANMSHEFRTPLISILGFSELLEHEIADNEQREMISAINLGGKRLLNSLESVLTLSHLESSNLVFKMKEVNLVPIINNAVKLLIPEALKKGLKINFESSLEEINVTTEENFLIQTINHLVDNAIKFTNKGEVKITLDYEIDKDKDYILISVHDTGIGIAENEQHIIFEAFRQASEGFARNYEGFGLGLTIAQKTMNLMNGKITVKSAPSAGSVFTIWLPFISIK
ncbi:MAG: multi-sensor hybrid histidine kinase [Ignavibacteria bacterium]|nr:MAG: multi-sensor hybrid histidine kinase [Ignavibacteria bacterium]KAF0160721.1 MAG: multi-sensor hybrid histidine kinase [Ignavibacteria bacterium]